MKKVNLKINGMVCNGCENRVKKAIMNIDGVSKVNASHKKGTVTITLKKEIEEEILVKTIENLGYEIIKEA